MSAAGTAPQQISVRALEHVIVLGSLVEHAELLGGVVPEHLAQPLIRSVFIALVSERPNMLARVAEAVNGTTENAVRDEHARVELELHQMLLECHA